MNGQRQPDKRRGELGFAVAIGIGLLLGLAIKRIRIGLLIGLTLGLLIVFMGARQSSRKK